MREAVEPRRILTIPLAAAVTVVLDGHRVRGYAGAFEINGHVFAPVRPYVTRIADRVYYAGGRLAIVRGSRIVYIRMPERAPDALDRSYVPLSSVVTALGAGARYLGSAHILEVRLPPERTVGSPEPFDPCAPQATPNAVFTPAPVATARPVYSGSPLPRRTPLPYARPTPKNSAAPLNPAYQTVRKGLESGLSRVLATYLW